MQVFIKTLTGNTITIECVSIDNLKQQILVREGLEIDMQRLNYGGKELDSESLCDGITIHLSSRIIGGKKKKKKPKKEPKKKMKSVKWSGVKKHNKYTLKHFLLDIVIAIVVSGFITFNMVNYKASPLISTGIVAAFLYVLYYTSSWLTSIYSKGLFIFYSSLLFFPFILKYVYKLTSFVYIEPPYILLVLIGAIVLLFFSSNIIAMISSILLVLSYLVQRYYLPSTATLHPSALTALQYSFFAALPFFVFLTKMS